jgi:hypothetical protein
MSTMISQPEFIEDSKNASLSLALFMDAQSELIKD